jgi:hypothetical protein
MKLKTLKNKYAFAYPLLALGLVLGSCSQEESDEFIPNKETQKNTLTFTANPVAAETKGISTKVSITPQRNNDVLNWEENDKVTFYFLGDNYEDKKTYTVSVDGSNASITGGKPGDPDKYKILALYPDRSSNFSSSATILTIPDALTQKDDNSHLKDYIYMYARPSGTVKIDSEGNATGGDIALDFTLLTSLLRFEIENTSSSDVTLKSVTISYPNNDAKLYSRVVLDEDNSVVSPANGSNSHASMTLNFSDLLLEAGEDTQGNLCVFPTTGASALNIELNVKLNDGTDISIPYEITGIQALDAGSRYILPLVFDESDLESTPNSVTDTDIIGGKTYTTYTYTDAFTTMTWMVDPLRNNSDNLLYAEVPYSCPSPYGYPTSSDLQSLLTHMSANPKVISIFYSHAPDYSYTLNDSPVVASYGSVYIAGGPIYTVGVTPATPVTDLIALDSPTSCRKSYLAVNNSLGYFKYTIRCVKKTI